MNLRELSKFLSGLITGDFIVGIWLYMGGDLPMSFLGIRVTRGFLPYWLLLDVILFAGFVYYGWLSVKKKK